MIIHKGTFKINSVHLFLVLVAILKREWSKLRENYRKCLKKRDIKTRSGAGSSKMPTCHFFIELQFLSHSLSNKKGDSNIETREEDEVCMELHDAVDTQAPTHRQKKNNKNTQSQHENVLDAAIIQTLNSVNNKASEQKSEKDTDTLFCLSLVDTLKSMTPKDNAKAKLEIQQILYNIQYEE